MSQDATHICAHGTSVGKHGMGTSGTVVNQLSEEDLRQKDATVEEAGSSHMPKLQGA